MKILVFIACLLAMVYAVPEKMKEFHDNFENCAQELNKPHDDVDVAYCALQKEGLIDEKGMYLIDKGFELLDEIMSDETKKNEAKEIIRKCYDEVSQNWSYKEERAGYATAGDINEKTMKVIQCGIDGLSHIDKI